MFALPLIIFITVIALLKRGIMNRRGFSDIVKLLTFLAFIAFIICIINPWIILAPLLGLGFIGTVALVIYLVCKNNEKVRAEKYGWNTEEYQQKYAEAVARFTQMYKNSRDAGAYSKMSATEQRAADLNIEKMAKESATAEVDAIFRERAEQMAAAAAVNTANTQTTGNYKGPSDVKANGQQVNKGASKPPKTSSVVKSKILPKSSGRRSKIVQKFNEQYNLYLTDEQIKRIVDASYMSNAWKREVEAMSAKYDSVYQWLCGDTAYLRAYLKAFAVQDVTSDFKQQMQIVMDSFEEVFNYSDEYSELTIDQRIELINRKFMTSFDEITYMIAYRYLESLGLHHELQQTSLNRMDGTFDDLVHKYDRMSTDDVDEELKEAGTTKTTST